MQPKHHLALSLTAVWGGTFAAMVVCVVTWNTFRLPMYVLAGIAVTVLLLHFVIRILVGKLSPAMCPTCGKDLLLETKPVIIYRCQACGYHWNTGMRTDSKPSSGGLGG